MLVIAEHDVGLPVKDYDPTLIDLVVGLHITGIRVVEQTVIA